MLGAEAAEAAEGENKKTAEEAVENHSLKDIVKAPNSYDPVTEDPSADHISSMPISTISQGEDNSQEERNRKIWAEESEIRRRLRKRSRVQIPLPWSLAPDLWPLL